MTAPTTTEAPATVNVPVVGTVQRRWFYAGGVVVVVIVGYAYLQRRRAAAPATFDPATGSPTSGGTYVNPVPGAEGSSDTVDSTPESIDTNDAWSRQVIQDLASLQINASFAAVTLGKYLGAAKTGTIAVTEDEMRLIRTAWALRGRPPEGAAEPVLESPGTAPTPTPTPTPAPVTRRVTDVGGDAYTFAHSYYDGPLDSTFARMELKNPGVRTYIRWIPRPGNPYGNQPVFTAAIPLNTDH